MSSNNYVWSGIYIDLFKTGSCDHRLVTIATRFSNDFNDKFTYVRRLNHNTMMSQYETINRKIRIIDFDLRN